MNKEIQEENERYKRDKKETEISCWEFSELSTFALDDVENLHNTNLKSIIDRNKSLIDHFKKYL